jgi:hypothetical protein
MLMPGMTCAVEFIVERSENVLAISNAALRYQPTALSDEQIADMVFIASLAGMDEKQRQAALEAREQAKAAGQNTQNKSAGITDLMMGGNTGGRNLELRSQGRGQGRSGAQERTARETIVMRNLWYMTADGKLEVIRVRTGTSNGSLTEIITEDDLEGKQFILREKI